MLRPVGAQWCRQNHHDRNPRRAAPPDQRRGPILGRQWGERDAELREQIGISLQETRLPERQTVRETLQLFRSFYRHGIDPAALMRRVALEEKADTWNTNLSGGQRQRLAVACALAGDPRLLFLDEPTTGLDPQSRRSLWDIIRQFRDLGRTVLLTTHYMDEAERLCDRVAIVDRGQVIACDTPRRLIASLGGEHIIDLSFEGERDYAREDWSWLIELASINTLRHDGDHLSLTVREPHIALPELLGRIESRGHRLASLTTRHVSLEDVFVTLTGRHLRDGDNGSAAA